MAAAGETGARDPDDGMAERPARARAAGPAPETVPTDPLDRGKAFRYAGLAVVALALLSVATTFLVLTGLTPIDPTPEVTVIALVVNGVLVAILLGGVFHELMKLWSARSAGRAGARLHVRIVALFSLMAVLPASLVAAVATITLSRGLDRWFNDRTTAIVSSSVNVADAYVDEHARVLRGDLIAMANDIDRARALYDLQPARFDAFLQAQTSLRGLPSAYLMRVDGTIATSSIVNPAIELSMPPSNALRDAQPNQPILIAPGDADQVGGVMKLSAYQDLYLYIARPMDPRVVDYLRLAAANAQEYIGLRDSRLNVEVAFGLVYAGVTLVLLVAAIWLGFGFANRLVSPIRHLIAAADSVARGNLRAVVPVDPRAGDIAHLGETFNTMTRELASQQSKLMEANQLIEERRRFTEAVLSGVSAGVIGVGPDGAVSLANRSALELLGAREADIAGRPLEAVLPEIAEVRDAIAAEGSRNRQHQITLKRGQRERTVAVRVTRDPGGDRKAGYVLTLDDITDLVQAQRTSAWADVARRIAHEIKNPLTPIQLSAERIKRRYGKRITDDREVFDQCIDTIIRQVGDIGRMVNEFSAFARMPKPVFERRDVREAIREAVFLQGVGHPDVRTSADLPDEPVVLAFDPRLVTQAISNLVKNAAEAIEQTTMEDRGGAPGTIDVGIRTLPSGEIAIEIVDNGIGLPKEDRQRLLEPYMTTREKGTGLGLAIVRKIAEEHGGRVELLDASAVGRTHRGACVRFVLPADPAAASAATGATGEPPAPRSRTGPDAPQPSGGEARRTAAAATGPPSGTTGGEASAGGAEGEDAAPHFARHAFRT